MMMKTMTMLTMRHDADDDGDDDDEDVMMLMVTRRTKMIICNRHSL